MSSEHKLIENLSKQRPKTLIDIIDVDTEERLYQKIGGDFMLKHENSIKEWFKKLPEKHNVKKIQIHQFRSNGSSYKRIGLTIEMQFKKNATMPMSQQESSASNNYVHKPEIVQHGLFGTGLTGYDLLNLKTKELDYERLREALDLVKEDNKRLKNYKDQLEIDLRKTKAELAIAEREKEIAVKQEQINQKSPLDNQTVTELVKGLPALLSSLKQTGENAQAVAKTVGLAGTDQLPLWKQNFIKAIMPNEVNNQIVTDLYLTIKGILNKPGFNNEFKELLYVHDLVPQPTLKKAE